MYEHLDVGRTELSGATVIGLKREGNDLVIDVGTDGEFETVRMLAHAVPWSMIRRLRRSKRERLPIFTLVIEKGEESLSVSMGTEVEGGLTDVVLDEAHQVWSGASGLVKAVGRLGWRHTGVRAQEAITNRILR